MIKRLFLKGLVFGIMIIFVGMCINPSTGITIANKSNHPISNGNTLYVGGSGPGNYSKIQDAIDNASSGDTVFVYDDSSPYYEPITIYKSINLIGEDKETTIIDGSEKYTVVHISADWVNISGFTIQNSGIQYPTYISGIYIGSNYCTITNNTVSNNWHGIYQGGGFNNNNIISNTISFNTQQGITISGYNNSIKGNSISNNKVGIALGGTNNNIMGNNISFNFLGGIILQDSRDSTIHRNNFIDNTPDANFVYFREHEWDKEPNRNTWKQNYWNRPRILPKIIFGILHFGWTGFIPILLPWINIDLHPAKEPYEI